MLANRKSYFGILSGGCVAPTQVFGFKHYFDGCNDSPDNDHDAPDAGNPSQKGIRHPGTSKNTIFRSCKLSRPACVKHR